MIIIAEVSELTRKIKLPTDRVISVNGDYQVDGIAFKLPATYEGDFDFSTAAVRVHWTGVDKVEHTNLITEEDGNGYPLWIMPSELTQGGHGVIEFAVSFIATDETAAVTKRWISDPVSFRNRRTVNGSSEDEAEEEAIYDRLASAIAAVRAAQASVDKVNEVLAGITNSSPVVVATAADLSDLDVTKHQLAIVRADGYLYYYDGSAWQKGIKYGSYELDTTLTESGKAADAAAVGAEVSAIKEDLSDNRIFLDKDEYIYIRSVRNGITFEPTSDKTRFHVSGTSTAGSFYNLYHNNTKLLDGITAGDKIYVIFNVLEHVFARILFYDSNQNTIITENIEYNRTITVPSNAVGMTVRYYVYTGYSPNVYVNVPIIVTYDKRSLFAPVFGNTPKYISFIDDDTTSDDLVTKYYNACMHNGVKGAYAVITGRYRTGDNNIELLRTYNYNGFNTILHCESQHQYLNTASSAFQRPRSIQNYTEAVRDFKNLNLVNPQNALITPYGAYNDEAKTIAKDMGFDLAFSTRFTRYNTTYETDRYALYRCELNPLASVSNDSDATVRGTMATCKARVDELSTDSDGGWLIITTHFNEWAAETWNETLDDYGFPIGYSRFNELVQYALGKGLEPISMAEGMAWIKKVLNKNEAISN